MLSKVTTFEGICQVTKTHPDLQNVVLAFVMEDVSESFNNACSGPWCAGRNKQKLEITSWFLCEFIVPEAHRASELPTVVSDQRWLSEMLNYQRVLLDRKEASNFKP